LLRADFFDSDSFSENEMVPKLEQSRSAEHQNLRRRLDDREPRANA
jgi:hypothetical protein